MNTFSRRRFLRDTALAGAGLACFSCGNGEDSSDTQVRTFHVCLNTGVLDENPEIISIVRDAGVNHVWLAAFLYGYWYYPVSRIQYWKERIAKEGLAVSAVTVPLGHPGDSLGAKSGDVPLTPPEHWKMAVGGTGNVYSGTSLHEPATEENREALRQLQGIGMKTVFLDDDFRLARGPGVIGGCFCDAHRKGFLAKYNLTAKDWSDLLEAVRARQLSPVLRSWIEYTCDDLTGSFRAQQEAVPGIRLGNMIMYLGAEKAGIRLTDYADCPFRVGELMFDDRSFSPVKGKTDELFSALFHRRFIRPENAYSESTAYPADKLSARNMAAKLNVSLLSDVRNTMYMSGLTPFPLTHWETLVPAMAKQVSLHKKLAGHLPRGPFKHYWGEWSRMIGDDKPYSLFLAAGIPFEVTGEPASSGWTFLSDADAAAVSSGALRSEGTQFIVRSTAEDKRNGVLALPETMAEMYALKNRIQEELKGVPFVANDTPAVCAWYPTARSVLLWNLAEEGKEIVLQTGAEQRVVPVKGLDVSLVEGIS